MTRRAAAEMWGASSAILRAATIAHEAGYPDVSTVRPGEERGKLVYKRYKDAVQRSFDCLGVLAIWRPELRDVAGELARACMALKFREGLAEGDAQQAARENRLDFVATDERAAYRKRLVNGSGYDGGHRELLLKLQGLAVTGSLGLSRRLDDTASSRQRIERKLLRSC